MTRDCTHIVQYREVNHRGRVDYRYLIHEAEPSVLSIINHEAKPSGLLGGNQLCRDV